MSEVRLDDETVEAIARRVAALLAEPSPLPVLLTAGEVAGRLGVTDEWVRAHADDLGGVKLADGPRPRWRFDPAAVAEALALRSGRSVSSAKGSGSPAGRAGSRRPRGPAVIRQKVALLPSAVSGNRVKAGSSPISTGRHRDSGPPPTPRMDPSAQAQPSPRGAKRASDGGPPRSKEEAR